MKAANLFTIIAERILLIAGIAVCPLVVAAGPEAPLGLAMVANAPESITLAWYHRTGDDGISYNIYASDKMDGDFKHIATTSEHTLKHGGLIAGRDYFYKISANGKDGEGPQTPAVAGFTFKPVEGAPFPVKIARNMCVSLGAVIVCNSSPIAGKLSDLVDGWDETGCRLRKTCEIKIQLNSDSSIEDAAYLLLHFRATGGAADWSNDAYARTLKDYVVIESTDSTTGNDGTWREVVTGSNDALDGVIVIPNHKPQWIGIRSSGSPVIAAEDRRPMSSDLMLCRLDIFRSAPAGYRNDYWIFTGDSLVVQDLPGGPTKGRSAWFSDLVRKQHPDRYPIVVHAARGGEMLKDTLPRMQKSFATLSPANGTTTPTGTIVCWETGFNDVGVGAGLSMGPKIIQSLTDAQQLCMSNGLYMVPVRIEYSTGYLEAGSLEPAKYNIFYNTLAVNLAGVDPFCRMHTPYACDPATQLPYADYWTYTRKNFASALVEDAVHHTGAGSDGINRLWAEVADRMIYSKQR